MIYEGPLSEVPPFSYRLIMADPPWSFDNWSKAGEEKNAKAHYACMSLDDIKALPVGHLAATDAILWLWATNPMLPQAFEVMAAWGFRFVTAGHWAKAEVRDGVLRQAIGTGYVLRSAGEPFLIGAAGRPRTSRSVRSVIIAPRREHSRKPDEAFRAAEALMPGARIELFSLGIAQLQVHVQRCGKP